LSRFASVDLRPESKVVDGRDEVVRVWIDDLVLGGRRSDDEVLFNETNKSKKKWGILSSLGTEQGEQKDGREEREKELSGTHVEILTGLDDSAFELPRTEIVCGDDHPT